MEHCLYCEVIINTTTLTPNSSCMFNLLHLTLAFVKGYRGVRILIAPNLIFSVPTLVDIVQTSGM